MSHPDQKNILYITQRGQYDLGNYMQRITAAGIVYHVAQIAFNGSLGGALMSAEKPHGWHPSPPLDGRSAEAKELKAAEAEMWKAIQRYDNARLAAVAKVQRDAKARNWRPEKDRP
jgi:hypothetical protein